jgi:hypothetical protein
MSRAVSGAEKPASSCQEAADRLLLTVEAAALVGVADTPAARTEAVEGPGAARGEGAAARGEGAAAAAGAWDRATCCWATSEGGMTQARTT